MKKWIRIIILTSIGLYVALCGSLYFLQERFIFFPEPLDSNFHFQFPGHFEEIWISAEDGEALHGLLFHADSSQGLVFYLHGNGGSLKSWGNVAPLFTQAKYDVFILDYRGYGKSGGSISSQDQLFGDHQLVYDSLKTRYNEDEIIVLGYSIGTGFASQLAANNNPKHLILKAPYLSLTDMMHQQFPFVPSFLLKYKLANHQYLRNCNMPITIFHGNEDGLIPFQSSARLQALYPSQVELIELEGQGHNGIADHPKFVQELQLILGGSE